MKTLDTIATALVIVGAVNWGLVGLFRLDLVAAVFGMNFGAVSVASAAVYAQLRRWLVNRRAVR